MKHTEMNFCTLESLMLCICLARSVGKNFRPIQAGSGVQMALKDFTGRMIFVTHVHKLEFHSILAIVS